MIIKKKHLLILCLFAWVAIFLGINYVQAIATNPVVTNPTSSTVGKDPCYGFSFATTTTKFIYNNKNKLQPMFGFYGGDKYTTPYGKGGTFVTAGNIAAASGSVFLGIMNGGTRASISTTTSALEFYVNNNRTVTFTPKGLYGAQIERGLEIKGNLKTDKIYLHGKEVKISGPMDDTRWGQNVLYIECDGGGYSCP